MLIKIELVRGDERVTDQRILLVVESVVQLSDLEASDLVAKLPKSH